MVTSPGLIISFSVAVWFKVLVARLILLGHILDVLLSPLIPILYGMLVLETSYLTMPLYGAMFDTIDHNILLGYLNPGFVLVELCLSGLSLTGVIIARPSR